MNHIGQKSIFYIDSQNRTSGTSGNFSINFAMPPNNTYNRIVVMQASVPKSFLFSECSLQHISIIRNWNNIKRLGYKYIRLSFNKWCN